jgi:hypothetical protein
MASTKAAGNVISKAVFQACARVRREVFCENPQLNIRTGSQYMKQPFTGEYTAPERYYHPKMYPIARQVKFYNTKYANCSVAIGREERNQGNG